VDWPSGTRETEYKCTGFWWEILKERDCMGVSGVEGK